MARPLQLRAACLSRELQESFGPDVEAAVQLVQRVGAPLLLIVKATAARPADQARLAEVSRARLAARGAEWREVEDARP